MSASREFGPGSQTSQSHSGGGKKFATRLIFHCF
jgi:hypothetical protein